MRFILLLLLRALLVALLIGVIIGLTFATAWPATYTGWYRRDIQTPLPVRRVMKIAMWTFIAIAGIVSTYHAIWALRHRRR